MRSSFLALAHVLFGKPVPTPHQVRGRLFPGHALAWWISKYTPTLRGSGTEFSAAGARALSDLSFGALRPAAGGPPPADSENCHFCAIAAWFQGVRPGETPMAIENSVKIVQVIAAALGIPVAAAGSYSAYKTY